MRRYKSMLVLTSMATAIFTSCGLRDDCYREYEFSIAFQAEPAQDPIRIHDTITVESFFSTPLQEVNSKEFIEVNEGFDFPMSLAILEFDSAGEHTAFEKFEFIPLTGKYAIFEADGFQILDFRFEVSQLQRRLKFQLVPKETGVYSFAMGYNRLHYDEQLLASGECTEDVVISELLVNGGEGGNFYLLQESGIPVEYDSTDWFRGGGFIFEVIEK